MAVRFTISAWFCQFVSANVLSARSTRYGLPPTASSWPVAFRLSASDIWSMGMRRVFSSQMDSKMMRCAGR